MTACPCTFEQQEALRRLSTGNILSHASRGEPELVIPRQAAAMRAAFACRFVALLGAALQRAAEDLATPPVSAGSSQY